RKRFGVAHYKAKSPPVGKARHVTVRRQGANAVIKWDKAALGTTYLVSVDYGSGDKTVLGPTRRTHVTAPNVGRREGLRIEVIASSAPGRRGPAAKAAPKGSMHVRAVKALPPYKP